MKVGLIARSNARGLGSQTFEAYRGYPFDSVLHVLDDSKRWPEDPHLYPGAHIAHWTPGEPFEPDPLVEFMHGLDAIFSVETFYDESLVRMADNRGIRTVVQANPEFVRMGGMNRPNPEPTIWTFPTPWMIDEMPSDRILPVPIPRWESWSPVCAERDAPLVVVHVAGHRAAGDRNGTDLVLEAIRMIKTKVTFRLIGQDGPNTIVRDRNLQVPDNVTLQLCETGFENRWRMYDGAHLVVLPRRYGGLCLPAIEAMSVGVVPMMPNCSPNEIWPIEILPWAKGRGQLTPYGMVETASVNPLHMAHRIDDLNKARDYLATKRDEVFAWAAENTWDALKPQYDAVFNDRP